MMCWWFAGFEFVLLLALMWGYMSIRQDQAVLREQMKSMKLMIQHQADEWQRRIDDLTIIKQQEVAKWIERWLDCRQRWTLDATTLQATLEYAEILRGLLTAAGITIPDPPLYAIPNRDGERASIPELDEAYAAIKELNQLVEQHFGRRI